MTQQDGGAHQPAAMVASAALGVEQGLRLVEPGLHRRQRWPGQAVQRLHRPLEVADLERVARLREHAGDRVADQHAVTLADVDELLRAAPQPGPEILVVHDGGLARVLRRLGVFGEGEPQLGLGRRRLRGEAREGRRRARDGAELSARWPAPGSRRRCGPIRSARCVVAGQRGRRSCRPPPSPRPPACRSASSCAGGLRAGGVQVVGQCIERAGRAAGRIAARRRSAGRAGCSRFSAASMRPVSGPRSTRRRGSAAPAPGRCSAAIAAGARRTSSSTAPKSACRDRPAAPATCA